MKTADKISLVSAIISAVSAILAICALYLTWLQARDSIEHNKISIKPSLSPIFATDFGEIRIANKGVGPAIIKNYSIIVSNQVFKGPDQIPQALAALNLDSADANIWGWLPDAPVGPTDIVPLFKLENPNSAARFRAALHRVKFVINYDSLGGDHYNCPVEMPTNWN